MRHEAGDMRQETGDRRQVHCSKKVMDENIQKNTAQLHNFFMAQIFSHRMWQGSAKIKWRGAVVALMRWRENLAEKLRAPRTGRRQVNGEKDRIECYRM